MKKFLFSLAMVALLFTACKDEDDDVKQVVDNELSGDISTDRILDASVEYKLVGSLNIVDGGILRIPAGTVIKTAKGFNKYILVEQGGKIFINGTAEKPVTMTSAEASPKAGDWGGLIINGKARLSGAAGIVAKGSTEVVTSIQYGGDVDTDNSGEIMYLKLLYTGAKSSASVEHNGLTLNGVGSGTKIENIFVKYGADDGIEFFGGSVNVKNLLVVNSDDDMFDVTQGWTGTLDNAYGVWEAGYTSTEEDPRGLELDGNLDGATPTDINQSNFIMKNITVHNKSTFVMHDAVKLRRGAKATITNILIKGGTCTDIIDLTDGKGKGDATSVIEYKLDGVIGTSVKAEGATVTEKSAITGANTSVFSWSGHSF